MDLEDMVAESLNWAVKALEERDEIEPIYVGFGDMDVFYDNRLLSSLGGNKHAYFSFLKAFNQAYNIQGYVVTFTAWQVRTEGTDLEKAQEDIKKHGSVSEHPDKVEVILSLCKMRDGYRCVKTRKVLREGTKFIGVSDEGVDLMDPESCQGEFFNLFEPVVGLSMEMNALMKAVTEKAFLKTSRKWN